MVRFSCVVAVFFAALISGCGEKEEEASSMDVGSVTAASFNTAGAPTVEFSVPDMMCPDSCAVKVKEILSEQPGAKEVVVDFDSKTATVAVERDKFDSQVALAALVDHMFDHSTLKSGAGDGSAQEPAPAKDVPAQPAS